jgi:hypothetical protein
MYYQKTISPSESNLYRVTSCTYKPGVGVVAIQVAALYEEAIGRSGRTIKRSITFHMNLEADGFYHWRKRVPAGARAWAELHRIFHPSKIPGLGKAMARQLERAA